LARANPAATDCSMRVAGTAVATDTRRGMTVSRGKG
jgi:hypothetical protein